MPQNNVAPAFNPDLAASLRAEMDRCAKCGQCRSICPVFIETGDEAGVARGRISLAEALLEGRIGWSARLQESFTKCLDCLRCDADCPSGVAHELILQAVRQGMARDIGAPRLARFALRHLLPRPRLFETALRLGAKIQGLLPATQRPPVRHLPLFLARGARLPRLAPKTARRQFREMPVRKKPSKPSKGRVAIFTGCLINAAYPEVAADLAAVLERIGYEPLLPQGQTCCGAPLLNFGEAAAARRVAEVNRRALAGSGAETVLTPCAACGHTLKSTYPRLLSPDWTGGKFRVLDALEFLAGAELGPLAPLAQKVAYHDPCQLRWGQQIAQQPRDLLRRCAALRRDARRGALLRRRRRVQPVPSGHRRENRRPQSPLHPRKRRRGRRDGLPRLHAPSLRSTCPSRRFTWSKSCAARWTSISSCNYAS